MKKTKSSLAVGLPTIVTILTLLLFACVSMLSLSRAQADYMTSVHGWDVTCDYFAADRDAQTLLGAIEPASALPPSLAGVEMEAILNEQGIAARYDPQTQVFSFTLPAGEAGTLAVSLQLRGAGHYKITAWRLVPHESEKDGT